MVSSLTGKTKKKSDFDPDFEIARITEFLNRSIESSNAKGFVIGISGGIDSAVVASLCKRSQGSKRVLGLFLFEDFHRDSVDYRDAMALANDLGIRTVDIRILSASFGLRRSIQNKSISMFLKSLWLI